MTKQYAAARLIECAMTLNYRASGRAANALFDRNGDKDRARPACWEEMREASAAEIGAWMDALKSEAKADQAELDRLLAKRRENGDIGCRRRRIASGRLCYRACLALLDDDPDHHIALLRAGCTKFYGKAARYRISATTETFAAECAKGKARVAAGLCYDVDGWAETVNS